MPEQCGCQTVEAFRTSAGFATDAEIIYCNLHARAAEMRELLVAELNEGCFDINICSNPLHAKARASLEATHA